jgi:hypothetical protein
MGRLLISALSLLLFVFLGLGSSEQVYLEHDSVVPETRGLSSLIEELQSSPADDYDSETRSDGLPSLLDVPDEDGISWADLLELRANLSAEEREEWGKVGQLAKKGFHAAKSFALKKVLPKVKGYICPKLLEAEAKVDADDGNLEKAICGYVPKMLEKFCPTVVKKVVGAAKGSDFAKTVKKKLDDFCDVGEAKKSIKKDEKKAAPEKEKEKADEKKADVFFLLMHEQDEDEISWADLLELRDNLSVEERDEWGKVGKLAKKGFHAAKSFALKKVLPKVKGYICPKLRKAEVEIEKDDGSLEKLVCGYVPKALEKFCPAVVKKVVGAAKGSDFAKTVKKKLDDFCGESKKDI